MKRLIDGEEPSILGLRIHEREGLGLGALWVKSSRETLGFVIPYVWDPRIFSFMSKPCVCAN